MASGMAVGVVVVNRRWVAMEETATLLMNGLGSGLRSLGRSEERHDDSYWLLLLVKKFVRRLFVVVVCKSC